MSQQGQLIRLTRTGRVETRLWAFRYLAGQNLRLLGLREATMVAVLVAEATTRHDVSRQRSPGRPGQSSFSKLEGTVRAARRRHNPITTGCVRVTSELAWSTRP
jgi:hypothetical protein